jgi:hypothetical protein
MLPSWTFFMANIPFGLVYIWSGDQWAGGYYELLGKPVSDLPIMMANFLAIIAQAVLYNAIWVGWRRERYQSPTAENPDRNPYNNRSYLAGFVLVLAVITLVVGDFELWFYVGVIALLFAMVNIQVATEFA